MCTGTDCDKPTTQDKGTQDLRGKSKDGLRTKGTQGLKEDKKKTVTKHNNDLGYQKQHHDNKQFTKTAGRL